MSQSAPLGVLHPITRMVIGGAQEATLTTVDHLCNNPIYNERWTSEIVCGPDLGPEGDLQPEARRRNIPLTIIPGLANPIRPQHDTRALIALYRFIKPKKYAVVHTHSTKAGLLGRLAAKLAGVPVIVHTVHGWGFHAHMESNKQRVLVPMERMAAKITDRMITVSKTDIDKGLLLNIGKPEQYVTIRSGINLDQFGRVNDAAPRMRQELGIPMDAPVVGTVTRLSEQKAPLDFVRVARIVAQVIPDVRFVVVGDGPLRADVERLIAEEELSDRFVLTGLRRDVPELMSMFDVFLLTSLWEGLPRVLPQAMATRVPVVATAADGSMEIILPGKNGLIAPPGAIQALADHVTTILRNPTLASEMGENGQERAREWSDRLMLQQTVELYEQLLRQKGVIAPS